MTIVRIQQYNNNNIFSSIIDDYFAGKFPHNLQRNNAKYSPYLFIIMHINSSNVDEQFICWGYG